MSTSRRNAVALIAGAALLIIASSTTSAVATKLITGAQIADRSITGADIKPGSVPGNRIEAGSVRLEHLHESAERAGHVYTSRPVGQDSAVTSKPRALSPRLGEVVSLINVPAGTYLAIVTGTFYINASTTGYRTVSCMLEYPTSQSVSLFTNQSSGDFTGAWPGTIADSRVFKSTAKGTVDVRCQTLGDYSASALAEIVLIPVSTYYEP